MWADYPGSTATTTDIPNTYPNYATYPIIWSYHAYVTEGGISLTEWEEYLTWAVHNYVTTFGKPLIIGEYGELDANGIPAPDFTDSGTGASWQTDLMGMISYLNSLPIVGYSWFCHGALYGEYANTAWKSAPYDYTIYSATDSEWILGENPSGYPTFSGVLAGASNGNGPSISFSPTSGTTGATVTVSGSGFADSSALTATFNGNTVWTGTSTSIGTVPSGATFTVPSISAGSYPLTVTDDPSNLASAIFNVNAAPSPPPNPNPNTNTNTNTNTNCHSYFSANYIRQRLQLQFPKWNFQCME